MSLEVKRDDNSTCPREAPLPGFSRQGNPWGDLHPDFGGTLRATRSPVLAALTTGEQQSLAWRPRVHLASPTVGLRQRGSASPARCPHSAGTRCQGGGAGSLLP